MSGGLRITGLGGDVLFRAEKLTVYAADGRIAYQVDPDGTFTPGEQIAATEAAERLQADKDLALYGQSFMVDGKRVSPERVTMSVASLRDRALADMAECPHCGGVDLKADTEQLEHDSWTASITCHDCEVVLSTEYTEPSPEKALACIKEIWSKREPRQEAVIAPEWDEKAAFVEHWLIHNPEWLRNDVCATLAQMETTGGVSRDFVSARNAWLAALEWQAQLPQG